MAAPLETNEIAAMGAAVDHRVDLAVLSAGDDDRRLAEKGRQIIPRLRQLAGKREILPGRPEKDPPELGAIDLGIGEHPVWNAGIAFGRPLEFGLRDLLLHGDPRALFIRHPRESGDLGAAGTSPGAPGPPLSLG